MKLLASKSAAVKVLASAALVGGAASVAGLGTFGAFTSTTSASQDVTTGKVVLNSTTTFGAPVTNMVPGDTIQRAVVLTRSNDTEAFGSVKLTTTSSTSNLLTSDATNGLQLTVEACPVAWVKAANTNDLTCSGQTDTVVTKRAVLAGTGADLAYVTNALNSAGKTANLKFTLTLPDAAGNTFQGLSNTINFTFDATQRAAKAL